MSQSDRPDEVQELESLPRTIEPPPELEREVVAALRSRGLVVPQRSSIRSHWWVAAACLVAAFGGWLARGSLEGRPVQLLTPKVTANEVPAGQQYLFLLAEPTPLRTDRPLSALIEEYRVWAQDLASRSQLVTAAKLDGGTHRLTSPNPGEVVKASRDDLEHVTGYFVVRAEGWNDAVELAASCPHVAHGGEISIRALASGSGATGL